MFGCLRKFLAGRVGEWLKPADCKSAAPCGLRRFESFPVHQALAAWMKRNRSAIASGLIALRSHIAMFEGGPIRGESAAQERCAAESAKRRFDGPRHGRGRRDFGAIRVRPG